MDTFSKHFTHSLSFNKCAVASVKVVSARKETRSAHVAISKMDVQNEGGQERKAPKQWKHPQSCHEVNVCLCLFLQTCMHMPGLFRLSRLCSSSAFSLPGGVPSLASGLDFLVCWFCMAHTGLTAREWNPLSAPNAPIGLLHRRCFNSASVGVLSSSHNWPCLLLASVCLMERMYSKVIS